MTKYTINLKRDGKIVDTVVQNGILAWPSEDIFYLRGTISADIYHGNWVACFEDDWQGISPTDFPEWRMEVLK